MRGPAITDVGRHGYHDEILAARSTGSQMVDESSDTGVDRGKVSEAGDIHLVMRSHQLDFDRADITNAREQGGVPLAPESHLRQSVANLMRLKAAKGQCDFAGHHPFKVTGPIDTADVHPRPTPLGACESMWLYARLGHGISAPARRATSASPWHR